MFDRAGSLLIELENGRKVLPPSKLPAVALAYQRGYQNTMRGITVFNDPLFTQNGVSVNVDDQIFLQ